MPLPQGVSDRETTIAVINDELITQAVIKDDLDARNANAITEDNDVEFTEIQTLTLSFRNIFKIDNLVTMTNLVSLKLDNNVIQKIEGIAHLTQLVWLDLSFNNIRVIEGLETLTKLTDLTLYNNQIAKLENLESLINLQVLSIGNNQLTSTEHLLYLRQLENLKVLNLDGNPVCSDPEYRPFVLAHLERLKYLDYALVDDAEAVLAREQYQDELEEFKEKKMLDQATKKREKEMVEYTAMMKRANCYILETLFTDMFKEDSEIGKVSMLPGLENLKDDYQDKVKSSTENVKLTLLEKHKKIEEETSQFQKAYDQLLRKTQQKSIDAHENYRRMTKKLFAKLRESGDTGADTNGLLQEATVNCEKLAESLMNLESDLVEQCQELINNLESQVETLSDSSRDVAAEHFRSVEELENGFFDAVSQLANHLLERVAAEDAEDDDLLSDECRAILNDRDALNNAISGSHDIHIGKLLAQEDLMREQGNAKCAEIVKSAVDKEWNRNRSRVIEIINLKEKNLANIAQIKDEITRVEEDFYN